MAPRTQADRADAQAGRVEAAAAGGASGGASGASNALTRTHRMTLDEAKMILNLKGDVEGAGRQGQVPEAMREELEQHYERLFTINAPPAPKGKTGGGQGSFYVQSKIVRARERIEAEWAQAKAAEGKQGGGKPSS